MLKAIPGSHQPPGLWKMSKSCSPSLERYNFANYNLKQIDCQTDFFEPAPIELAPTLPRPRQLGASV